MRVIVATDGSDAAGVGIELVAGAAWPPETVVRVVTAIDPSPLTVTGPFGVPVSASPDPLERLDEAAAAALESACRRLAATDPQVEGSLLRGRPASAIVDVALRLGADLVVLGSRGHGMIETMLLGSVSAEVVDHAPMPVLVARDNRVDRVVLAWDGSDCAARAAELLRWPMFARSAISVVGVAEPEVPWWAGMSGPGAPSLAPLYMESAAASRREYDRLTRTMAAELKAAGLDARAELRSGDAAEEIIVAAGASAADLVVIGTHGRSGLARLVTGSVARNVLHHAPCSVLISR
jgi:nucleotide-binding universal stress UspA family protein